jgi:FKBP-type peptidyl-prolyl cis-trans isomerase FkpA
MRKVLPVLFLSLIIIFNNSCSKNKQCEGKTAQEEQGAILNYAASNGITATAHSTGLYYQIISAGSGATPSPLSTISVKYTGKLLNGTVFDSRPTTPVTFTLGGAILGWQIGLQLIKKGGSIRLIIPSSLAYGCQGAGSIPSNSVLYFDVELTDVQ